MRLTFAVLAVLFCCLSDQPVVADFELTLEEGVGAIFGSAEFTDGPSDRASEEKEIIPGSKHLSDSGSTSTGGVDGEVNGQVEYDVRITDELIREAQRSVLRITGSGFAEALIESTSAAAFTSIDAGTLELGDAFGSPLLLRLASDAGPVRFHVLEDTSHGIGSVSITPELGTDGFMEPGDYFIHFRVGVFVDGEGCSPEPPPCSYEASSDFSFEMELLVPEPATTYPTLLGAFFLLMGIRRKRRQ